MAPLTHSTSSVGRIWSSCLTVFLLLLAEGVKGQLNNATSPTSQFKSRPDLHPPIIQFEVLKPSLITPGYIFLAPYRNLDPGPYIYDNYGNLVWSGAGSSGPKTAHTPRVCSYQGSDHLCYFQGEQHQGFARGHGVIMDKNYRIVKTVESSGAGASSDMHEFKMTPYSDGTTALMTVYQPRQYDLSTNPRFNVRGGMGWVVEGVFQEVEIETGKVVFEWRSLDHVDPGLSWTMPATTDTSGDGLHEQSPWDYFHLNSIDKNIEGDYLLSARHVSAIYKISGKDGHIIWQMGGNSPDFIQENFGFSYQHHARWISENATHTVISFYDNGSNTYNATSAHSHGFTISINHQTRIATRILTYGMPGEGLRSGSQGNMQILESGNVHLGWGEHPWFTEHTPAGEIVQYGKLAERASNVMIYRSNKYNWTATPLTKPALWTYSLDATAATGLKAWVSWNGATEVAKWDFYTAESAKGPWRLAGSRRKTGFETLFESGTFAGWTYAQALDREGNALEDSVVAKTFVPGESLRPFCDGFGCGHSEHVSEELETPYTAVVEVAEELLSPNRGFDTTGYYEQLPGTEIPSNEAKVEEYTSSSDPSSSDPSSSDPSSSDPSSSDPSSSNTDDSDGYVAEKKTVAGLSFFTVLGIFTFLVLLIGGLGTAVFVAWKRGAFGHAQRAWHENKDTFMMEGRDKFEKARGKYDRVREREMEGSGSGSGSSEGSERSGRGRGEGRVVSS